MRTFPAPTRSKLYPDPVLTVFKPPDGDAIVDRSAHRGNTGDKNGRRFLEWNALPLTSPPGVTYAGTIAQLKALEGLDSVINLGTTAGGIYSADQDVTILSVSVDPINKGGSGAFWHRVKMDFIER